MAILKTTQKQTGAIVTLRDYGSPMLLLTDAVERVWAYQRPCWVDLPGGEHDILAQVPWASVEYDRDMGDVIVVIAGRRYVFLDVGGRKYGRLTLVG